VSAEASELVSIPGAELDALKAGLKRLRREVGRGAAMARIQADSAPGDDAPAFGHTAWRTDQRRPVQGVIAIAYGPSPTGIGGPGVFVAVAIGVTECE
jgi:hypothetical protein